MKLAAGCMLIAGFSALPALAQQTAGDFDRLGNASVAKSDWKSAETTFSSAINLDPKDTDAIAGRGIAEMNRGENDKAVADFTQAIQLAPKDSWNYLNRGHAKAFMNDISGAVADCTQAVTIDPTNTEALHFRGRLKAMSSNFAGAKEDWTLALQGDPTNEAISNEMRQMTAFQQTQDRAKSALTSLDDIPEVDHVRQQISPASFGLFEKSVVLISISEPQAVFTGIPLDFNLPHADGLISKIVTSQNSMEDKNGASVSITTKVFSVEAVKAGDYTIPAFDIGRPAGQTYHVNAMNLHVHD